MADGRDPARAVLAVAGAVALVLSAGLLPTFSAAAPVSDPFRDLGSYGLQPEQGPGLERPGGEPPDIQAPDGAFSFLRDLFGAGGGGELTRDPRAGDRQPRGGGPGGEVRPPDGDGGDGGPPLLDWLFDLDFDRDGDDEQQTPADDAPPCPTKRTAGPYTVCFEERLVPGTETVVAVYRDGEPAAGVELLVNGDSAGRTDRSGRVRVTVPYTDRITVDVRQADLAAPADEPVLEPPADGAAFGLPRPSDPRAYALAANDSASVPVETGVAIELRARDGDPSPGERALVRATVERVPVRDAAVYVDGERVATTDDRGVAPVRLPVATSVNVTVVRGAARGGRQVTIAAPTLRANGPLGLAVPGADATVVVTDDGVPVENATVRVAGERVGRTDANGTVAATLPLAPVAGLGATFPSGLTASKTLHLWVPPVVGLLLTTVLVGGAVVLGRRSERGGRDALSELAVTLRAVASDLVTALVGLAAAFEETATAIADRVRAFLAERSLPDLDAGAVVGWLRARVARLWVALLAAVTWPLRYLRDERGNDAATGQPAAGSGRPPTDRTTTAVDAGADGPRARLRRAWWRLVRRAGVTRPRTTTPGQVAGRARSRGLPREPVGRLTAAFRAVEYGGEDPSAHADSAETAADALDDGSVDGGSDGDGVHDDHASGPDTDGGEGT